jgi:iron complex transport system substrate-binding protein
MLGLLGASLSTSALVRPAWSAPRTLVDSVGRSLVVPDKATRILAAGPPAAILTYAMAPDAMLGWVAPPATDARPFLLPQARDLPVTGRLTLRGQEPDLDAIGRLKPDLVVDFGSVGPNYVSLAEKIQKGAQVPYALIDGQLDKLPKSLRLAGDIMGRRERGEALAVYAEQSLARIDAVLAKIPAARRPRFYLARGSDGLQSAVKGSGLTEVLERAGGINAAEGPAERGGIVTPTFDQVASWKPDIIVTFDQAASAAVRGDAGWRKILAGKRVLIAPTLPWGWLGEPPSLNQLLGLRWLASVFYPSEPKMDLLGETRDFHRLFYGVAPADAALSKLVEGAQ